MQSINGSMKSWTPIRISVSHTTAVKKGNIKNRNGMLRQTYPKKFSWSLTTQEKLDKAALRINSTPMNCLG